MASTDPPRPEEEAASPAAEAQQQQQGYYNPRPVDPVLPVRLVIATTSNDASAADADAALLLNPPPSPPPSVVAAAASISSSPRAVRLHVDPLAAAAMDSGASASASVALLCNSAVGAGVLALPFALARAGLAGGLLLCALFCACEAFTLYVLAKFAERYGARTYGQLVRRALGRRSSALLSGSMFLLQFGACVAYLVIVGDAFSGVIGAALAASSGGGASGNGGGGGGRHPHPSPDPPPIGPDSPAAQRYRTPTLIAVALGVIFPLCLPSDLAALEKVSAAAVAGFAFTAFTVVLRGWQLTFSRPAGERLSRVRLWPADKGLGLLDAIPLIVFGFNSHANVVTIFHELQAFPSAPRGARRAARRAAAAMGGLGSRVGSVARSLAQLGAPVSPLAAAVADGSAAGGGGGAGGAAVAPPSSPRRALLQRRLEQQQQLEQRTTPPPPLLPGVRTRKLFGMVGVIAAAMALIALGYALVAVAGFVAFAPQPPSNILNAFPPQGDGLVTAARLVIGLVVVAHYPLAHHPAREALGDLVGALFFSSSSAAAASSSAARRKSEAAEAGGGSAVLRFLTTAAFVASTLIVAVAAGDLGGVLHLLGGTVASAMIFGLPGLLLINASIIKLTYFDASGWEGEEDEEEGEEGASVAAARRAAVAAGPSSSQQPLLPKKAGIRERGLIYSPGASWWAGVAMIALCALVMGLTLASAFLEPPRARR
jgi:amino acid permease